MLFTFPSRYWFAIGLLRVFSLGGWARRIHTGLLVSRATQGYATLRIASCTSLSLSMERLSKRFHSLYFMRSRGPTTPKRPKPLGFGLFPVRSPLLRESLLFSFPPGTKMFQFPGLSHHKLCIHLCVVIHYDNRITPFGYLRIFAYLRLPEAFRRSLRPSSALNAKAFTVRSFHFI